MKKPARFRPLFIFSTSIFLAGLISSCGRGNNVAKTTFDTNAILSEERNLTVDEINIANRICLAYKSKSTKFRSTEFYGTNFNFQAKKTDCQNVVTSYTVSATLKNDDQNNLAYIPPAGFDPNLRFNRKVQTDVSGYLAQLCPKLAANQAVTNTSTNQNVKAQISFFRDGSDQTDGYIIQVFTKQTNNTFLIDSAEKFKSTTGQDTSGGKIYGMDKFYSTQKVCPSTFDKNKFSDFEQTFISR